MLDSRIFSLGVPAWNTCFEFKGLLLKEGLIDDEALGPLDREGHPMSKTAQRSFAEAYWDLIRLLLPKPPSGKLVYDSQCTNMADLDKHVAFVRDIPDNSFDKHVIQYA